MMRIFNRLVAASAKGLASLHRRTRSRRERQHIVLRREAVERRLKSTRRALCFALMVLLFVSATPSAPKTIVALSRERQASLASWLRGKRFPAKLYRNLEYGYARYSSWTGFINRGAATPRSSVKLGHSPGSVPDPIPVPPVVLNAPTNVAVISTTNAVVNLSWTAPTGTVAHYRVERGQSLAGPFFVIANAPTTNHEDTTVSAGTAYLYRVRAVDGSGMPSPPSTVALGMAITFTDATLQVGTTPIRKQHIYDLRQSVNAVRTLAGVGTFAWTHPDLTGLQVQALHVQQLREKLDQALATLNIPVTSYEDSSLATGANGTLIKKKHIEQLRERSTSGSSTSTGPAFSDGDISIARLDAMNRTGAGGEDPLSRNFNWSVPLVGLPGRSGLDLGLSLSYNSLVWTRSGSFISFDDDQGFPSPGFRLGFPVMQGGYFNSEVGKWAYLLITPGGGRIELRQIGTSTLYEAADSSHILFDSSTLILKSTDGTQLTYRSDLQCSQIKDRNGNFITVNYTAFGRIDTVVDTLSRTIKFNYDGTNTLTSISQTWTVNGVPEAHEWASFTYNPTWPILTNFSAGVTNVGPQNGSTKKVLTQVTFADSSRFDFDYTSWGQVWKVSNSATGGHLLNYRSYNLRGSPMLPSGTEDDCPRFTERHDWARNWNRNGGGIEQEAITQFAVPVSTSWTPPNSPGQAGKRAQVTLPDGTYHKIYYHGIAGTSTGWHRGLSSMVETFDSGNDLQRRSVTKRTQDSEVSYPLNPRVVETNIYDGSGGNRRRVTRVYTSFGLPSGSSCQLPTGTQEYAADATTFLRRTETDYRMHPTADAAYLSRHIIGVVNEQRLYGIDAGVETLMSKVGFSYDETAIQGTTVPVKHDSANYGAGFLVGRANLTSIKRHDVSNTSLFVTSASKYNRAGALVETTDAANHSAIISYTDAFAAEGDTLDPALGFVTLAYPTTVTDADGYSSSMRYNYDFGSFTWKQTPTPNLTTNTPGPKQVTVYDSLGRVERVRNLVNNAYTHFIYGPNYVESFSSVNSVADEAHELQVFDGAGRTIAMAGNHPNSTGGFSGQLIVYDTMGRVMKQSNPTETNISITVNPIQPYDWVAVGDDAYNPQTGLGGWVYSQQTYDWKGRSLVTTNTDGTTKEASYAGCGCAGGEVVTLTDEGNLVGGTTKKRQQKIYSDVLGRTAKTEVLNWDGAGPFGTGGSVYSATVNSYTARDQLTKIRQYAGSEGSGTFQDTLMTYDGHGRLNTRHTPEQNAGAATIYAYNADDTVQSVTDARGGSAAYTYNNRHLITAINYNAPGGITPTSNASFAYDAVGNRISMTDGLGSQSYAYNQLSQMTSESRILTSVGTFALGYDYNLAGELKKITDPTNMTINYGFDSTGRLNSVTGSDNLFLEISTYASSFQYRAWNGLKAMTDGSNHVSSLAYNSKLQPTQFDISGGIVHQNYDYENDGRLSFVHNTSDAKFDRSYFYDHAGRLTEAKTGGQARGDATASPYYETFGFDAFSNLTARQSNNWTQDPLFDSASYTNHRRSGWGYDGDGRNTTIGTRTYGFDADGQVASMTAQMWIIDHYVNITQTLGYDGDGQKLKEGLAGAPTYYLRSTVLNGAIIAEIDSSGQKKVGYVYTAEGEVLAKQVPLGSSSYVVWKNSTAAGTGQYDWIAGAANGNGMLQRVELDPMGADVGIEAPQMSDLGGEEGDVGSDYFAPMMDSRFSDFFDLRGGCTGIVLSSCQSPMTPNGYAQAQARAMLGDRWYDLPGNNNVVERTLRLYVRDVHRIFAEVTAAKAAKAKPKPTKPTLKTVSAEEHARRKAAAAGYKGNEDDPLEDSLDVAFPQETVQDGAPRNDCLVFAAMVDIFASEASSDFGFVNKVYQTFKDRNDTSFLARGFKDSFVDTTGESPNQVRHSAGAIAFGYPSGVAARSLPSHAWGDAASRAIDTFNLRERSVEYSLSPFGSRPRLLPTTQGQQADMNLNGAAVPIGFMLGLGIINRNQVGGLIRRDLCNPPP